MRPARSRSPQEQQLEAVLSAIEERAIDSPERALFEVDDGVAAINAAASHLGVERASERQIVFVERMQELSAEENADVTADEVEGLRAQLRHRLSHLERERVERRYLAAVDRLGPVDRWLELRWAERELRTRHAD